MDSTGEGEWARICRIEATRTTHRETRNYLLELAAEYEALARKRTKIPADTPDLPNALADRLGGSATKGSDS